MNEALLRNLTLEELLHEMYHSQNVMLRNLSRLLNDLYGLHDELIKHDIDLSLVVKDYQNFDMKLSDFLETEYWQNWNDRNRDHDIEFANLERWERCQKAAEYGCDGSTHREVIQDWLACLDERDADLEFGPLTVQRLMIEAENTQKWHEQNGTINDQIG